MSPRALNYLMTTAFLGGHVGLAHGVYSGIRNIRSLEHPTDEEVRRAVVEPMINGAFSGLFLGPWGPLIIPYWILRGDRAECPLINTVTGTLK